MQAVFTELAIWSGDDAHGLFPLAFNPVLIQYAVAVKFEVRSQVLKLLSDEPQTERQECVKDDLIAKIEDLLRDDDQARSITFAEVQDAGLQNGCA